MTSLTFVIAVAMHTSTENQVCLGQLGEEVSESWVSLIFFLTTISGYKGENTVENHDLKYGSCPDHILGHWRTVIPVMTYITHLDWV